MKFISAILLYSLHLISTIEGNAYVHSIFPRRGGRNGGVKLTVHGRGFPEHLFSLKPGSESDIASIELVSERRRFGCDLHQNDCSDKRLVCYTRRMPQGDYHVRLTLNGKKLSTENYCNSQPNAWHCTHYVREEDTPMIYGIDKHSGPPKSIIETTGRIFTVRIGSNTLSANATNNRLNIILRYYFGPQNCQMLKDSSRNEPYKMRLDGVDGEKDTGVIACKLQGSYVGNLNASFIIDGDKGRSETAIKLLRVSRKEKIYLFQTYAEISSLSIAHGGTEGGTLLKIAGSYFDETDAKPRVTIAGVEAEILSLKNDGISILTPKAPSAKDVYPGNRGMLVESWTVTKTLANIDDIKSLTSSDPGYKTEWIDESKWQAAEGQQRCMKSKMFFVAPRNSSFKFALRSQGIARLFFSDSGETSGLTQIAEATKAAKDFKAEPSQLSAAKDLLEGVSYLLEWIHCGGEAILGVHQFNTDLNSAQTGEALDEVQQVESSSDVVPEIQTLNLTLFPKSKNGNNEIQTVKITTSDPETKFSLTYNSAKTPFVSVSSTYQQMQEVLNGLPTIRPGKITVKRKQKDSDYEFEVRFIDNVGQRQKFNVEISPDFPSASGRVTRVRSGTNDYKKIILGYGSTVSGPTSINVEDLTSSIKNMFSIGCHSSMVNPSHTHIVANDYEDSVKYSGAFDSDEIPYCGLTSLRNPGLLYKEKNGFNAMTNRFLCLAFRGEFQSSIRLRSRYYSSGMKGLSNNTFIYLKLQTINFSDRKWHYECFDIILTMQAQLKMTGFVRAMVYDVYFPSAITKLKDSFVDAFYIGSDNIQKRLSKVAEFRKLPSFRIRDLKIESLSKAIFKISFKTWDCASNLQKFEILNAQASEFSVTQDQAISEAVKGSYDLLIGRQTVRLKVDNNEDEIKEKIEEFEDLGEVSVIRYGGCYDRKWKIKFLTKAGDVPNIIVSDKSGITGNNADIKVIQIENGGIFYAPIGGDMLQTSHTKPQVIVDINDIPSRCLTNCDFEYKTDLVPTVTAVQPKTGSLGTEITLMGTGFEIVKEKNKFSVDKAGCIVTSATTTEIKCNLGIADSGDFKMRFYVEGKGKANFDLGAFSYAPIISSFAPKTSNPGGNIKLTIYGAGFVEGMEAVVGGNDCAILKMSKDTIICNLPPSEGATTATVTVTKDSNEYRAGSDFTYSSISSVTVTALDKTEVKAIGEEQIEISGSGFGDLDYPNTKVMVGDKSALIENWEDTKIVISLPKLKPGEHDVFVMVPGYGPATNSAGTLLKIKAILEITGISSRKMSAYGGNTITITGNGFGTNSNDVRIEAANTLCKVLSMTDTEIVCKMGWVGKETIISNEGTIAEFGKGYAWYPKITKVQSGDRVTISWKSPSEELSFSVFETASIDSTKPKANGFAYSGPRSTEGSYRFTAGPVGEHTFSTGFVDKLELLKLQGKLIISEKKSFSSDLIILIDGMRPDVSSVVLRRKRSASCTQSLISGCSDSEPKMTGLQIAFWTCLSPSITSVTPNEGYLSTEITIAGRDFSSNKDCVEVKIGGQSATIVSSSSTQIVCKLKLSVPIESNVPLAVDVNIKGNGYARNMVTQDSARFFKLIPNIESVSPTEGPLPGGTEVTILGGGFVSGDLKVKFGSQICRPIRQSSSEIVCLTEPSLSEKTMTIDVKLEGKSLPCTNCNFHYKNSKTPKVTSVTPSTISNETELTITGTNLGSDTSLVEVYVGDIKCLTPTFDSSNIKCTLPYANLGKNTLKLKIKGVGRAEISSSISLEGVKGITNLNPPTGSTVGGLLVNLLGNGFGSDVKVQIGSNECEIYEITPGKVIFQLPPGSGTAQVKVTFSGLTDSSKSFTYDSAITPEITSITPNNGKAGDKLTIAGLRFGDAAEKNEVIIDKNPCTIESASVTQIICVVEASSAGEHEVKLSVKGIGRASGSFKFTYKLEANKITPSTGGLQGGQIVIIEGNGFGDKSAVDICGSCKITSSSPTKIECITPIIGGAIDRVCDVVISNNEVSDTKSSAFTYSTANTPAITSSSPLQGGSAGGTLIAIKGSGFGTDKTAVSVTKCKVKTVQNTLITCRTLPKDKDEQFSIKVEIKEKGQAKGDFTFEYKDFWSSPNTWGGDVEAMPKDGDFIIIKKGQTMYLDTETPILKMLLIQGGELIFDDSTNTHLRAENILVLDGGLLQIGTEEKPYTHQAKITLYGHLRALELPVYGAKTLGVRNGTLDIHGLPVKTWTLLDGTVNPGAKTIKLTHPVNWKSGDEIVVASTGDHKSQNQNEKHTIKSISSDGKTITLEKSLEYKHLGVVQSFEGGVQLETKAEVGLLSRNVIIRGSDNLQWHDRIAACPAGFDPGEFAVQTCFQGRFGEEIGSDEFGGQIMIHQPLLNANSVKARISHAELTYMGQAFRLGRYPIHFHLNGDMSRSYVKGCSIHKTFNRAINIHNTHKVLVEQNVIYDVMGGAVFLEDSIETENILQYNLLVFVRSSTSLLNDDISAAAFWITHPNNIVRHNHCAGGTHFGFWYRMREHPEGPSYDPKICPRKAKMGEFFNNTVHSVGWYGLWDFEDHHPTETGTCSDKNGSPAVFKKLIAWNNFRGAEWVHCGAIQFHDFIVANNFMAGIEMYFIIRKTKFPYYTDKGAMLKDLTVISHLNTDDHPPCTRRGIVLPFANGLLINGVKFINFDGKKNGHKTCSSLGTVKITCVCSQLCAGYNYKFKGVEWYKSIHRADWEWEHQGEFEDIDGSLTGLGPGSRAMAASDLFSKLICSVDNKWSSNLQGMICRPGVDVLRFTFNQPEPESLLFKNVSFENSNGVSIVPFARKRDTYAKGWMALLPTAETYNLKFINAEHITNFSYHGGFYGVAKDDFLTISHTLTQDLYDSISVDAFPKKDYVYEQKSSLSYSGNENAQWYFDKNDKILSYLISDKPNENNIPVQERHIYLRAQNCLYKDCKSPDDTNSKPSATERPANAIFWSDLKSWQNIPSGYGGNNGDGTFGLPKENTKVLIPEGVWMVLDIDIPKLSSIIIRGALEIEPFDRQGQPRKVVINVENMFITGHFIAGWEKKPFEGSLDLIFRGDHSTIEPNYQSDGAKMGTKGMGVFGGIDLHGKPIAVSWTRLVETAKIGDKKIYLEETVDWKKGDTIVISTTSYSLSQTEIHVIKSISNSKNEITLAEPLKYTKTRTVETINNKAYKITAEVGLLTRNIKVIGASCKKSDDDGFGARILVAVTTDLEGENIRVYKGFARIENTEFVRTGQLGYVAPHDPRFSLAFVDIGKINDIRPSYIKNNAFHHGFAPTIGIFGTNGVSVKNNVVYRTVGSSIISNGRDNTIERNLITNNIFPGTYGSRTELVNFEFFASIEIQDAEDTVLKDNVVAGSERVAYRLDGDSCDTSKPRLVTKNEAHGVVNGIWLMPEDCRITEKCSRFQNFIISKAWFFGVYVQVPCNVEFDNLILVDNTVGIFPMIIKPNAVTHAFENKYAKLTNSLVVGTNPNFDCKVDKLNVDSLTLKAAEKGRSWTLGKAGRTGMSWPSFASRTNGAPEKPHKLAKKEPGMYGIFKVEDVTVARFKESCFDSIDRAFATNPSVPDMAHPIHVARITKVDVSSTGMVHIHRPDLGLVNGGDCVDMDCDGLKKAMIKDTDGSFLGFKGAVIPESEFEWDGDARRGLGDYRIPKTLLTTVNGQRKDVEKVRSNKGIIRNSKCTYVAEWPAYKCPDLDYELFLIESMDPDYEERRLSPVALLSDTGYLDLNNGPRDVNICHGYTCRKRISLFYNLVATLHEYVIHFTSTTPQKIRLHLPNAKKHQSIRVAIFWGLEQPVHAYVNHKIVLATNEVQENGKVNYKRVAGDFIPNLSDKIGSNWFNINQRTVYVIVRGGDIVTLKLKADSVILKLGMTVSVEEFYGKNVVEYLRIYLGLEPSQVKVMNVVSDNRRRRKRSTQTEVVIEIGNHELDTKTQTLTYENLNSIVDKLKSGLQSGQISNDLGLKFTSMHINKAVPPADDARWQTYITKLANGESISETVQTANKLILSRAPVVRHEGAKFSTQPSIKIIDELGRPAIGLLTSTGGSWQVKVSLKQNYGSDKRATLLGTQAVNIVSGWANFTNLGISHSGSGYQLVFTVNDPTNFKSAVNTEGLLVKPRPLNIGKAHNKIAHVGEPVKLRIYLTDAVTNEIINYIGWKYQQWKCYIESHSMIKSPSSVVSQKATVQSHLGYYDTELSFDKPGRHLLKLSMISNQVDYYAENYTVIDVLPKGYREPSGPSNKTIKMKFNDKFRNLEPKLAHFEIALFNDLWLKMQSVRIGKMGFKNGSIIITFQMIGTENNVNDGLDKVADYIEGRCNLFFDKKIMKCEPYMYVNGSPYDGLDGDDKFNWKLYVLLPVLLGAFCLIVLIIAIVIIVKMNKGLKEFHPSISLFPENISPEFSRETTTISNKTASTDRPISRQDVTARLTPRVPDAWTEKT